MFILRFPFTKHIGSGCVFEVDGAALLWSVCWNEDKFIPFIRVAAEGLVVNSGYILCGHTKHRISIWHYSVSQRLFTS